MVNIFFNFFFFNFSNYIIYKTDKITFEEAKKIFKKYDRNQNGSMDMKEFKPAFMELISPKLSKHEIIDGVI